jgi:hypothetical protein
MYEYISVCVYLGSCQHIPGRMKAVCTWPKEGRAHLSRLTAALVLGTSRGPSKRWGTVREREGTPVEIWGMIVLQGQ